MYLDVSDNANALCAISIVRLKNRRPEKTLALNAVVMIFLRSVSAVVSERRMVFNKLC